MYLTILGWREDRVTMSSLMTSSFFGCLSRSICLIETETLVLTWRAVYTLSDALVDRCSTKLQYSLVGSALVQIACRRSIISCLVLCAETPDSLSGPDWAGLAGGSDCWPGCCCPLSVTSVADERVECSDGCLCKFTPCFDAVASEAGALILSVSTGLGGLSEIRRRGLSVEGVSVKRRWFGGHITKTLTGI